MTHHELIRVLRILRAVCLPLASAAIFACQSVSLPEYSTPQPLVIGVLTPDATLPKDGSMGSTAAWHQQVASDLGKSHVAVKVIVIDAKEPNSVQSKECDILVQPIVEVSSLGSVSNNAGAVASNLLWLTTYFGYFFVPDMTVQGTGKIGFRVYGHNWRPMLTDAQMLDTPDLAMTFGERDRFLSSRFFMGLILFPALHPAVCRMFGAEVAERDEIAAEVRNRFSISLARGIAEFVEGQLAAGQEAIKLSHVVALHARRSSNVNAITLIVDVRNPTGTRLRVFVQADAAGGEPVLDGRPVNIPGGSSSPQLVRFEVDLGAGSNGQGSKRLTLSEANGRRVTYTIDHQSLLQLAGGPATELRN